MLSVSVDRSSLSLPALVFADPATGLWVPEDGYGRPGMRNRNQYAGNSPWLDGSTLVSSTLEQSSLPLKLYVSKATTADLYAAMDEVEAAFNQFTYATTVTLDGSAQTWACDPADVDWGEADSGMARAFLVVATVTVPVFPRSS